MEGINFDGLGLVYIINLGIRNKDKNMILSPFLNLGPDVVADNGCNPPRIVSAACKTFIVVTFVEGAYLGTWRAISS